MVGLGQPCSICFLTFDDLLDFACVHYGAFYLASHPLCWIHDQVLWVLVSTLDTMSLTSNTKTRSMSWIHLRIKNLWYEHDIRLKPENLSVELYKDYTAWCFFLLLMNESTDCIYYLVEFHSSFILLNSKVGSTCKAGLYSLFKYRDTSVVIRNEQTQLSQVRVITSI